jgi:hypothetical protein
MKDCSFTVFLLFLVVTSMFTTTYLWAMEQTLCPVMEGNPVNKEINILKVDKNHL